MATSKRIKEWPIYNCHIHTFTRRHTPENFIKFVLSDSKIGRVNLPKVFLYLLLFCVYVVFVWILGILIPQVATQPGAWNMAAYAFLLLLEGLCMIPLLVLAVVVPMLAFLWLLQKVVDAALDRPPRWRMEPLREGLMTARAWVRKGQKMLAPSDLLVDLLAGINPNSTNDIFERIARFLKVSGQPSQKAVFEQIRLQYQTKEVQTRFVVLPMDMTNMGLGPLKESIDEQHEQLLDLVTEYPEQIIPFYAADPGQPDIVEKVRDRVVNGPFRGIKIYPNLGYPPNHKQLMHIYAMCAEHGIPVMTHCSPGGVWQYGLPQETRRKYSQPESYRCIFEEFPSLKLCLAHFGGAEEWARRLNRDAHSQKYPEEPWVRTIYDMITGGETEFRNLYADISYTAFTPRVQGLYVDLVDYLKVMLSHPRLQKRVLFGSDYYMIEQEKMSEKEASVLLRSRLGEGLYKQIAYTNPRRFLRRKNLSTAQPVENSRSNGRARRAVTR